MKNLESTLAVQTIASMGALAFIVACFTHEVLGHGIGCISEGGHITLLTSVYFRSEGTGFFTDLLAPFANLIVGVICLGLLKGRTWSQNQQTFLVLLMAFNLFWFSGCLIETAISNKSDFAYPLRVLSLSPPWIGRISATAIGVTTYHFSMRLVKRHAIAQTPFAIPYFAAGFISCLSVFFFSGPFWPAIREAALESFGSAIGLLLLARKSSSKSGVFSSTYSTSSAEITWLTAGLLVTLAFILILGRGIVLPGHA